MVLLSQSVCLLTLRKVPIFATASNVANNENPCICSFEHIRGYISLGENPSRTRALKAWPTLLIGWTHHLFSFISNHLLSHTHKKGLKSWKLILLAVRGGHVTQFWPSKRQQKNAEWSLGMFSLALSLFPALKVTVVFGGVVAMLQHEGKPRESQWCQPWHQWVAEPNPAVAYLQTACYMRRINSYWYKLQYKSGFLLLVAKCFSTKLLFKKSVLTLFSHKSL